MIGALKGTVFSASQNSIILFAGGQIGYTVFVTNEFLKDIKTGKDVFLFIHSHIREDAFDLFGFLTKQELVLFELLLTVPGIGPKTALLVVDRGVSAVTRAVQKSDVDAFTTIPRLGKKNAQKIIIELKSKLGSTTDMDLSDSSSGVTKEVMSALSSMGFARKEIAAVLQTLPPDASTIEEKIRFCLVHLGKSL